MSHFTLNSTFRSPPLENTQNPGQSAWINTKVSVFCDADYFMLPYTQITLCIYITSEWINRVEISSRDSLRPPGTYKELLLSLKMCNISLSGSYGSVSHINT